MPEEVVIVVVVVVVVVVVAVVTAANSRTDIISSFTHLSLKSVVGRCSYMCSLYFAL
jgi:hypothetical protein